jgi:hypothetical protein
MQIEEEGKQEEAFRIQPTLSDKQKCLLFLE